MLTEKQFTECFHLHFKPLCYTAQSYTRDPQVASDLVQDSFLKMWERRDQTDIDTAKGFLYLVTINAARNYVRHLRVVRASEEEVVQKLTAPPEETEAVYFEYISLLYEGIEHLSEGQKKVFKATLRTGEKKALSIIADELGIAVSTVKEHKLKAYKKLRALFKLKFPSIFKPSH